MRNYAEKFFTSCRQKFGDKYDYSISEYRGMNEKIKFICSIHGVVEQTARCHLNSGCPRCSGVKKTKEDALKDFESIHGDFYNYDEFEYKSAFKKSVIICPKHGRFLQNYNNHFHCKKGCPKCGSERAGSIRKGSRESFIKNAIKVHGDRYSYDNLIYTGGHDLVTITCKKHGDVEVTASNHLRGHHCPYCSGRKFSLEDFLQKAKDIHGDKYDYKHVESDYSRKIKIVCPEHGEFYQDMHGHLAGNVCPKCSKNHSKGEEELYKFVLTNFDKDSLNKFRGISDVTELDVYSPSKKIGIEFNGIHWHSERYQPKDYHINKTQACKKNGINLIHIFEDEWKNKVEICKSIISNKFGHTKNKIYARKCQVEEVDSKVAKIFLEANHIQGSVNSSINIGIFYNETMVGIMSFGKPRFRNSAYDYELTRMCFSLNTSIIGGASKMFSSFKKKYNPKSVFTYADLRWGEGEVYKKLGFRWISQTSPNYFYTKANKRYNRFKFRKSELKKMLKKFDGSLTEKENMLNNGYLRIYDCGNFKYEWKNYE